jgi:hypothetical protein
LQQDHDRAATKGLRRLGDLEGIESLGEADKLQFEQLLSARFCLQE